MAQRTIKNYTNEDLILKDLGNIVVPANGALDIGGNESKLIELASSEDLLTALSQGIDKYQLNDGLKDLPFSQGIEAIRKIQRPTEVDELGRWVVRADSRKAAWDTVFQGAADDMSTGRIGGGVDFRFDFDAPVDDPRWLTAATDPSIPEGYLRQRLDWSFADWVYIKEGALYFFNMPKGSYLDFWFAVPPGGYFQRKTLDEGLNIVKTTYQAPADQMVKSTHFVIKYPLEGSAPMGDELNTESAAEVPAYPGLIWRVEVTTPNVQDYQLAHGHWTLELYRISQDKFDIPEAYW